MWVCELVEEEGSRVADLEAKAEHFVGRTANMLRRKWYEDLRERPASAAPRGWVAKRTWPIMHIGYRESSNYNRYSPGPATRPHNHLLATPLLEVKA